jgi:hypothetical protein
MEVSHSSLIFTRILFVRSAWLAGCEAAFCGSRRCEYEADTWFTVTQVG